MADGTTNQTIFSLNEPRRDAVEFALTLANFNTGHRQRERTVEELLRDAEEIHRFMTADKPSPVATP